MPRLSMGYGLATLVAVCACTSGQDDREGGARADGAVDSRPIAAQPDVRTSDASPIDSQPADSQPGDARPATVLLEANVEAALADAMVSRGTAAFRLKPFERDATLVGLRFLTSGDQPPGLYGGGDVDVELWRGRSDAPGSSRLARAWIGGCDREGPRPCWTGPEIQPPVLVRSGAADIWIVIGRLGGEGGSFQLPLAAAPASSTFESWSIGQVRWDPGTSSPITPGWVRAPADLPWVFRLLGP